MVLFMAWCESRIVEAQDLLGVFPGALTGWEKIGSGRWGFQRDDMGHRHLAAIEDAYGPQDDSDFCGLFA